MKKALAVVVGLSVLSGTLSAQEKTIDTKKSTVEWKGEKVTGQHTGVISIDNGMVKVTNNELTAVTITIDMTSLKNTDMEGEMSAKLEGHLKSPDFFDVSNHPTATFTSTLVTKTVEGFKVTGDLTIKGITNPVTFDVVMVSKGSAVHASGTLVFDRTLFEVRYGSGSFFDDLGDKMIYDEVELEFSILAENN